jgi:hypothetical protein
VGHHTGEAWGPRRGDTVPGIAFCQIFTQVFYIRHKCRWQPLLDKGSQHSSQTQIPRAVAHIPPSARAEASRASVSPRGVGVWPSTLAKPKSFGHRIRRSPCLRMPSRCLAKPKSFGHRIPLQRLDVRRLGGHQCVHNGRHEVPQVF